MPRPATTSSTYDSLVAKLLVHQPTRRGDRVYRPRQFIVEGIRTTIPLHREIFNHSSFIEGHTDTTFIEIQLAEGLSGRVVLVRESYFPQGEAAPVGTPSFAPPARTLVPVDAEKKMCRKFTFFILLCN
jgi:hypothetical protein